jgi:hypothetical protein
MSAAFGSLLSTAVVAVSTTLFAGILLFKYRENKLVNRLRTALKQEIELNNEQKVKEGHIRTEKVNISVYEQNTDKLELLSPQEIRVVMKYYEVAKRLRAAYQNDNQRHWNWDKIPDDITENYEDRRNDALNVLKQGIIQRTHERVTSLLSLV